MVMQKIEEANKKTMEIILNGQPTLIGIGKALDVVPGMTEKTLLHAGLLEVLENQLLYD
jgi:hypothetical protein